MNVCYLWQPQSKALSGWAWARALGAVTIGISTFERTLCTREREGTALPYTLALADLEPEGLTRLEAAVVAFAAHPSCKLVLHVAHLPAHGEARARALRCAARADVVLSPSAAVCAELRAARVEAHTITPPCSEDAGTWAPLPGRAEAAGAACGCADTVAARPRLTVVTRRASHLALLRDLGPLAYTSSRLARRVTWLDPEASPLERTRAVRESALVYVPAPIDDGGALAACCARYGAVLIAHRGYDAAQVTFPFTTFDPRHPRRRGLLLLWLYGSAEYRAFFREYARHVAVRLADENRRVELLRRLEYRFPEQTFVLARGPRPSLSELIRHRTGPLDVRVRPTECLLVCLVHNGAEHIDSFLRHYRALGVRHFFFIDNGSDDGTLALLERERDVTTYASSLPHKHFECDMRRLIIERHCRGAWCLNVDIDELFDYPSSDRLPLSGLLGYLEERGATAMAGYMLDMYARDNRFGPSEALDLKRAYPCYDLSDITSAEYHCDAVSTFCDGNVLMNPEVECRFGGIRKALFGSKTGGEYVLTKHPLIFLDGRLAPVTHPHYSNYATVADVTCVLYHYKFTPSFKAKVAESRASRRYVAFAQGQYEQYDAQLRKAASLVIDTPGTRTLTGVAELVTRGFLMSSPAYEDYVQTHGARDTSKSAPPRAVGAGPSSGAARLDPVGVCACIAVALALGQSWLGSSAAPARLAPVLASGPAEHAATGFSWLFAALGAAAAITVGAALTYMLGGLWQRRRYLSCALAALGIGAALTPAGARALAFACSAVVMTNALCYVYFAARALRRPRRPLRPITEPYPFVSVIIPAKDEATVIDETLASLDGIDYPADRLELIVIDDGSTDDTAGRARSRAAELRHALRVERHETCAGKARRLNEVLPSTRGELVLILDADHTVPPNVVRDLVARCMQSPDIACVQSASAVRNGAQGLLTRALEMEYLFRCRGIYPGKRLGIFVGSGGMFRREALLDAGGFDPDMLTEDVELSYRLYARGQRIEYEDRVCTTELAVGDFRNFFNQRHRWMRGLWQALLAHRHELESSAEARRTKNHFLQFTADGFGALCMSVLEVYFLFGRLGLPSGPVALPLALMLVSCSFAFGVGFARGGRLGLVLWLPLVPLYMVLHGIPMAWALIDSYVLGKPVVWVKTERTSQRAAAAHSSGAGA